MTRLWWILFACVPLLLPLAVLGQEQEVQVSVGVVPEVVTVGEPFESGVRITVPDGWRIEYGEYSTSDSVQALSPVEIEQSPSGFAAVYRLVAWAAGAPLEATVPVRLVSTDGEARVRLVRLGLPRVRSVLPPDSAVIEPRAAKAFIELPTILPELPWWLWALAIIGALLTGLIGYWLLRRLQPDPEQPTLSPLDWAVVQLDQISLREEATQADSAEAYRRLIWVLRSFLERADDRFGTYLTSSEVVAVLEASGVDRREIDRLREILAAADRVKFGAGSTTADDVKREIEVVRGWIVTFSSGEVRREPLRAA